MGDDQPAGGATARSVSLDTLVRDSDFIIIHAPYTGDNYHMFDRERFAAMAQRPYLINVGRGELVDNEALLWAIEEGYLAGAALDVVEGMPPIGPGDPLAACDKVVLTPHCAWYSERSYRRIQQDAAAEVKRVMEGGVPRAWYNKKDMISEGKA